jgi:hypothetical protein
MKHTGATDVSTSVGADRRGGHSNLRCLGPMMIVTSCVQEPLRTLASVPGGVRGSARGHNKSTRVGGVEVAGVSFRRRTTEQRGSGAP